MFRATPPAMLRTTLPLFVKKQTPKAEFQPILTTAFQMLWSPQLDPAIINGIVRRPVVERGMSIIVKLGTPGVIMFLLAGKEGRYMNKQRSRVPAILYDIRELHLDAHTLDYQEILPRPWMAMFRAIANRIEPPDSRHRINTSVSKEACVALSSKHQQCKKNNSLIMTVKTFDEMAKLMQEADELNVPYKKRPSVVLHPSKRAQTLSGEPWVDIWARCAKELGVKYKQPKKEIKEDVKSLVDEEAEERMKRARASASATVEQFFVREVSPSRPDE